jgi:hypothetical protein
VDRGSSSCLTIGGLRVEQAVVAAVLEALQPAGVQAALDALERVEADHDTKRQALELALEKAHYEVHRARRQYDRVDPDHRLVASELERRWNEALERMQEVEAELAALESRKVTICAEQRQRLLSVGQNLRTVWHHPAASEALKQRSLRAVLHESMVATPSEPPEHLLHLHWHGGVHSELRVARHTAGKHGRATPHPVLDLIAELSKVCRDVTIASTLNRLGYRTGTEKTWRAHSVASVRYPYRLPNFSKAKDWLTLGQAAEQLEVSETVVKRLITQGTLPASPVVPLAPWIIRRADLALSAVQAEGPAVRASRRRPCRQPRSTDRHLQTSDVAGGAEMPSPLPIPPASDPA